MKYLVAIYRTEKGGKLYHIREWRSTKKQFKDELRAKGLIVLEIYTPMEIARVKQEDLTNKHDNCKWYVQKTL